VRAGPACRPGGCQLRSFRGLLAHLGGLARVTIRIGGATFEKISKPTRDQLRAFDLIGVPVPLAISFR
jgi:hypothetical protein